MSGVSRNEPNFTMNAKLCAFLALAATQLLVVLAVAFVLR